MDVSIATRGRDVRDVAGRTLYQRAHTLHHDEKRFEEALELYERVREEFPGSEQAGYAETQIENIREMPERVREQGRSSRAAADGGQRVEGGSEPNRVGGGAKTEAGHERNVEVKSKFTALETISGFLKFIAILNAVSTVGAFPIGQEVGFGAGIVWFLICLVSAAVSWTLAEVVVILPAIEKNTRKVAKLMETLPVTE